MKRLRLVAVALGVLLAITMADWQRASAGPVRYVPAGSLLAGMPWGRHEADEKRPAAAAPAVAPAPPARPSPRLRPSPASMLDQAGRRTGKDLPLQWRKATAFWIKAPAGWVLESDGLNFAVSSDTKAREYGMGFARRVFATPQLNVPMPNLAVSPYRAPADALKWLFEQCRLARDFKVLAESPGQALPADVARPYRSMEAFGPVDLRVFLIQFTHATTGRVERGLYIVASMNPWPGMMWECWLNGGYAPADEFDDYLPLYVRMCKSFVVDQEWTKAQQAAASARQQQLNKSLEKSRAEARKAWDDLQESIRESGRVREYCNWRWSQTFNEETTWVDPATGDVFTTRRRDIGERGHSPGREHHGSSYYSSRQPSGHCFIPIDNYAMWKKYVYTGR